MTRMNQEEAERVAHTLKRNPKHNRKVKVTGIVHHKRGSVVNILIRKGKRPATISSNHKIEADKWNDDGKAEES